MSHHTANRGVLFVAPPAPGSPADYFERAAACTPVLGALSLREDAPSAMTPLPAPPARLRRLDACDASAGIVTTIRDTVSCSWIFYSNSSASTAGEGGAPAAEPDPALDSMHMMLDPHLRPISPDLTKEESKRIFEKHKQLAQEYLKVQTELAYQSNHKNELEEKMDDDELRQKREIIQLENEKESLIKLYCSLKKQLARVENDDWLEEMPHE